MIALLHGVVEAVDTAALLLNVQGVGYEVRMPSAALSTMHIGQEVTVYTSLAISQDAVTLYGFSSMAEKRMFTQLQKVSGIGPKVALSILGTLGTEQLAQAVSQADAAALAKAPGLGKKGAQKIILELKGSFDFTQLEDTSSSVQHRDAGFEQVVEGLMSLGWRQHDAYRSVEEVCKENKIELPLQGEDVPRVLKLALSALDRGR